MREKRRGVMEISIAVFRGKGIRKTIHNNEWWFSVADVVEILAVEGKNNNVEQ